MAWERRDLSDPTPFARRILTGDAEFRGRGFGGLDYNLTITPTLRSLTNGTAIEQTIDDAVYDVVEEDDAVTNYQIDLGLRIEDVTPIDWSSSDEAIATIDSQGKVTHVSDGNVIITAESAVASFKLETPPLQLAEISGIDTKTFKSFVSDSLRDKLAKQVDTRIAGLDATVSKHIYTSFPSNSNYTDATETRGGVDEFVRNPLFWGSQDGPDGEPIQNLTCISPSHTNAGSTTHRRAPAGTLISPIHYVSCEHFDFNPAIGSKLYFVELNGTVHFRTIVADVAIDTTDLQIGILDSALPAGIAPAQVFPNAVYDLLFDDYLKYVPVLCLDQQEHGMIHELTNFERFNQFAFPPTTSPRYAYVDQASDNRVWDKKGIESSDSGNPAFVVLNNQLVILTVWMGPRAGAGSHIMTKSFDDTVLDKIQSAMDVLSTAHSKTQYNLTYATL